MPLEERFITFNLDEVYKAILIHCIQKDIKKPPEATLNKIEIKKEGNTTNVLAHITSKRGKDSTLEYEQLFFISALISFCQSHAIPLPSRGQKLLNIMEDKIIMKITLERETDKSAAA